MIALLFALAVLAAAAWLYLRRMAGRLPSGQVVYRDTDRRTVAEPITSRRLRMTGKPDYVYAQGESASPVEVKKRRAGKWGPRMQDVAQLMSYCVLVEDVWGLTVTHGFIEYSDRRFAIPFGPEQRRQVLEAAEAIRQARRGPDVSRGHAEPWRCGACGYRERCGQALVSR